MKIVSSSKRPFVAVAFAMALVAGSVAPTYAFLDKTRVVLHLGVAYWAFHHFVVTPYQAGSFAPGAPHRVSTIVKGGVAMLFAVHEIQVADKIVQTSNDPLLHKLDGALTGMQTQFTTLGQKFKSGNFDPADIATIKSQETAVTSQAGASNLPPIQDKAPPVPIPGT